MNANKNIQIFLLCCSLQFTVILGSCLNYEDTWKDLIANNANDIEKLTKFLVKIRQEEETVKKLRSAIFMYRENENSEEFKNKINSLKLTESSRNCENYAGELVKLTEHNDYDSLKLQDFYLETKQVQRSLSKLHESVSEYLVKKNVDLLANAINNYDAKKCPKEISFMINNIRNNYHKRMESKISEFLIANIHNNSSFAEIPDILWHLYQGDVTTLEFMTLIQLSAGMILYSNDHNAEKQYNQKLSCILFKIQEDPLYEQLPEDVKIGIESFVQLQSENCAD